MITRPLPRTYSLTHRQVHVTPAYQLARGGTSGLALSGPDGPMMRTKNGGYVPAAQDPTDPQTWSVPVIFT